MVFSDLFFLFVFIPLFALCYMVAMWVDRRLSTSRLQRGNALKNMVLVIFSLIFYAWESRSMSF